MKSPFKGWHVIKVEYATRNPNYQGNWIDRYLSRLVCDATWGKQWTVKILTVVKLPNRKPAKPTGRRYASVDELLEGEKVSSRVVNRYKKLRKACEPEGVAICCQPAKTVKEVEAIVLAEYAYWREADEKVALQSMGAMGALANVYCAILGRRAKWHPKGQL
jgi:hypothetical protein